MPAIAMLFLMVRALGVAYTVRDEGGWVDARAQWRDSSAPQRQTALGRELSLFCFSSIIMNIRACSVFDWLNHRPATFI